MKSERSGFCFLSVSLSLWLAAIVFTMANQRAQAQGSTIVTNILFSTSFERSEGYDGTLTLIGQNGWVGQGTGGNGIVTNFFEGFGQQAYIGFEKPSAKDDVLSVWRPLGLPPINTNAIIKFSVLMQIVDSTITEWDDFRWSVYNTQNQRLFSLDFDNSALKISYGLDDGKDFVSTGTSFDNKGTYALVITMNFARNLWSASLNDIVIVNSQPITTVGSKLDLGDVDAVWALHKINAAGDNFMLFDNYTISSEMTGSMRPQLEQVGFMTNGTFVVRVHGEPGLNYVVEGSSDLTQWQQLQALTSPTGGSFDFQDTNAPRFSRRFYRAWVRP